MKKPTRIALVSVAVLASVAVSVVIVLWAAPPALLRIGANYAAKVVCSNVFIAGRDADEVLRDDVQAPGTSILKLVRVSIERDPIDREQGVVRAGFLGVHRRRTCGVPGPGSAARWRRAGNPREVVRFEAPAVALTPAPGVGAAAWPDGEAVRTDPVLDRLIADDVLTGPATRAVLVVSHGALVAERYGPGFDAAHAPARVVDGQERDGGTHRRPRD